MKLLSLTASWLLLFKQTMGKYGLHVIQILPQMRIIQVLRRLLPLNQWSGVCRCDDYLFDLYVNGVLGQTVNEVPTSGNTGWDARPISEDVPYRSTVKYWQKARKLIFPGQLMKSGFLIMPDIPLALPLLQENLDDVNTRGLWHMNDTAGSTTIADSSGNGNTATLFNQAHVARNKSDPVITGTSSMAYLNTRYSRDFIISESDITLLNEP